LDLVNELDKIYTFKVWQPYSNAQAE